MVALQGNHCTVTSWGAGADGQYTWRARASDGRSVDFTAPRDAADWWLGTVGDILLGFPITGNAADLLCRDDPMSDA